MDEVDTGFRVVSANEVAVESLPSEVKQKVLEKFSGITSKSLSAIVVFVVKDNTRVKCRTLLSFGLADDSFLAEKQEYADGLKREKDEIIKDLNSE
jgi:hypothetical protein